MKYIFKMFLNTTLCTKYMYNKLDKNQGTVAYKNNGPLRERYGREGEFDWHSLWVKCPTINQET